MGQGLRSPKGNVLRQLAGIPGDIDAQARELVSAAGVMESTATALRRLADGTDTISKAESVDAVRESAGDVVPQLEKAATRYRMTGDTLIVYAGELETAQNAIRPKIDDIEEKHEAVRTARSGAAHGWYSDLQNPGVPAKSSGEQEAADRDLETAEGELEDAWAGFDQVFGVWEEAYDRAVDGIDDAFDAADNNDAWGEDYLTALGYVAAALCVVALICSGPVALVIGAIGLAIGAVILAITIMKRTKGRGSNADLAWAVVGVLPFVRPLTTAKGAIATLRSAKVTLAGGKAAVRKSARLSQSVLRNTPKRTPPKRGKPSKRLDQSRVRGNARKQVAKGLLKEFKQGNSLWNRVKMNVGGGGHSDVKALGNFIRANPERAGTGAVEWAASNAPEISTLAKWGYGFETSVSFAVAGDFAANEHVVAYSEWRNQW